MNRSSQKRGRQNNENGGGGEVGAGSCDGTDPTGLILCDDGISEMLTTMFTGPCEDYMEAQRALEAEKRWYAELEIAASNSTPYPLIGDEDDEDEEIPSVEATPPSDAVAAAFYSGVGTHHLNNGIIPPPLHINDVGTQQQGPHIPEEERIIQYYQQQSQQQEQQQQPNNRIQQQPQHQASSALPLHRKSSMICTTPDPRITSSSKLRKRKLRKRSSMLSDGYAILDSLKHGENEEYSQSLNTEKGSALLIVKGVGGSGSASESYNTVGEAAAASTTSNTPSSTTMAKFQQMYQEMAGMTTLAANSHDDAILRNGIPRSISRAESISVNTFGTSDVSGGYGTVERPTTGDPNRGNPQRPRNYRPRFASASNEAFASSLRRSVQVLKKHEDATYSRSDNSGRRSGGRVGDGQRGEGEAGINGASTAKESATETALPPTTVFPGPLKPDEEEEDSTSTAPPSPPPGEVEATRMNDSTEEKYQQRRARFFDQSSILQIQTALYLSAFAILGASCRIFLGWLFSGAGGDCGVSDPTNIWCITSSGLDSTGSGVFFRDLPANMIGSFLMGMLQKPSQDLRLLGVLEDMGIAWLNTDHWFQDWWIFHLGLRTGFCGSLTTFASWNTQMIRMIDGSASEGAENGSSGSSNWISAIFGYILGLQMSLSCLRLGQEVAIWMYRKSNPALAKEEDVLMYAYTKDAQLGTGAGGDEKNGEDYSSDDEDSIRRRRQQIMPDYEMRYLASLLPNEELRWATQNVSILQNLERWKVSTDDTRLYGDPGMKSLRVLHQIEECILVDEAKPSTDLLEIAFEKGWDVEALKQFAKDAHGVSVGSGGGSRNRGGRRSGRARGVRGSMESILSEGSSILSTNLPRRRTAIVQTAVRYLPFILAIVLVVLLLVLDTTGTTTTGSDDPKIFRKLWVSVMLAPLGAVLRWELLRFNGKLKGSLQWLPLGTFVANITACIISATASGIDDSSRVVNSTVLLYGIKIGFAGSLSTVSSFVAEGNVMQSTYPHHAKAYYYMVGSLLVACAFGLVFYSSLARTGGPV